MTNITGGCLCGSIRYALSQAPVETVVCHCRNCQKQAGSALSVVAVVPRASLAVKGELKVFEDRGASGHAVFRKFCPDCGSPVVTDTPAAERAGIVFVKAGTMDDVSHLRPAKHYWTQSAQPWFHMPDDAEILETQ
jgi:hypothetical protein